MAALCLKGTLCDGCGFALPEDLKKLDSGLAWLLQLVQNISNGPVLVPGLNHFKANAFQTKVQAHSVLHLRYLIQRTLGSRLLCHFCFLVILHNIGFKYIHIALGW